ncbi:hypothetical protein A5320_18170 [Rheinheimera sp. SA_1]|nr:non-ribosomal peptide synthetase [Rheinheimera sp. SA_1]OBP13476.1 hypothetical protein A5320_18170 [Rheinheimera sp. SA_1]
MSVNDLFDDAGEQGVLLYLKGGKLAIKAKKDALTPELKARIVEHKTAIIEYLQQFETEESNYLPPPAVKAERSLPLQPSFAQLRLWFLDQLAGSVQYNLTGHFLLEGELQRPAFTQACQLLLERHEVLRTCFVAVAEQVYQQINPIVALPLQFFDLSDSEQQTKQLQQLIRSYSLQPFDLSKDLMIRLLVITFSEHSHLVYYTLHHIAADGWSKGILQQELNLLYQACQLGEPNPLPPLELQYADYAHWQRQWLQGKVLDLALGYWTTQLADLPQVHNLPLDKPRPARQRFIGHLHQHRLDTVLSECIDTFNRNNNTTLFMLMHTVLTLFVSRYSGERDIVIGTAISGRVLHEFEPLVGLFINDLAIRAQLIDNQSFAELLQAHKQTILEAYAHQHVPFEMLVEQLNPQRNLSYSPLYQLKIDVQHSVESWEQGSAAELAGAAGPAEQSLDAVTEYSLKNDLHLNVIYGKTGILLQWRFNTDLFADSTIARWSNSFVQLLGQVIANPQLSWQAFDLLCETEQRCVLDFGRGPAAVGESLPLLHRHITEQASRTPSAVAVCCGASTLSYAELEQQSNQLAHYLLSKGVQQNSIVAICMERSVDMPIALLGVLKAGAAYLPIEPHLPSERIDYMLADCRCQWVVTDSNLMQELAFAGCRVLPVDAPYRHSLLAGQPVSPPPLQQTLHDLAYLIYTSGSTGTPKGVMVSHHGLSTYCDYAKERYYQPDLAGSLVATSYSFDLTVPALYLPLLSGGQVRLLLEHDELAALAGQLHHSSQPFLLRLTPSHIAGLLPLLTERSDIAHTFVIGGEALPARLCQALQVLLPNARLYNHYGPTEAVVGCCSYQIGAVTEQTQRYQPIGTPMRDTQLLVLNERLQLCPIGVTGELYIGGGGLALGYSNNPALTAERFVHNPFAGSADSRMYRTGDLVRWLPDGNLQYVARLDHQVKLRGRRIELGEIEQALSAVQGVLDCAVKVWNDSNGQRLVACVVSAARLQHDLIDETELLRRKEQLIMQYRKQLAARLPDYMVPQIYLFLDSLPLARTGKLDRNRLPDPTEADLIKSQYVAPRNDTESRLCQLWQQVLQLTQIGIDDDFFLLGGHSLLATRLINLVRSSFGVELDLRVLFETPTVAAMAVALTQLTADSVVLPPVVRSERSAMMPLSYAQRRLWFIDQLGEGSRQYNVSGQFFIEGEFQQSDFAAAAQALVARHEVLRTNFVAVDGEPGQLIRHDVTVPFWYHDFSLLQPAQQQTAAGAQIKAMFAAAFDLSTDVMFRLAVLKLAPTQYGLFYAMHHIASDGWSKGIVQQELTALVAGQTLPVLAVQYADFAIWQQHWLQQQMLTQQLNYWRQQLADLPVVHQLPLDGPRPAYQNHQGKVIQQQLNRHVSDSLARACQDQGVTPFMVLETAFAVLIGKYSAERDIAIGTPIAGRTHGSLEPLIGVFINTLVLRTDLRGNPTFSQLLQRQRQIILDAFTYQHVPFELLVDELRPERSLSHNPLVQLSFVMQNNDKDRLSSGSAAAQDQAGFIVTDSLSIKYELELAATELADGWQLSWAFQSAVFAQHSIVAMAANFQTLLQQLLEDMNRGPMMERGIDAVRWLSEQEKQFLRSCNETAAPFSAVTIHQQFEQQVLATPMATAVVDAQQSLSYAQLNLLANRLANRLLALGIRLDEPVGVMAERSVELTVAVLAILKAGGCYVPLPPEYPAARLQYMVQNSGLTKVVCCAAVSSTTLPEHLQRVAAMQPQGAEQNPSTRVDGDNLCYVLYTSGSTGVPKGVAVSHRALVNRIDWMQQQYRLDATDRILQKTPYSFDVSVWELLWPLTSGATLVLAKPQGHQDVDYLAGIIAEQQITLLHFVPSMLSAFLATNGWHRCDSVRQVVCSGEALSRQLQQQFFGAAAHCDVSLDNLYGPTEAAIDVTHWRCIPDSSRVPIGKPIQNIQLYVVDQLLQPVATGCTGELLIGGVALARGYINRPGLSAASFIADHLSGTAGGRLYRTGDLVRRGHDGNIEYLGRLDHQIKIRGQRIELAEIETVLAAVTAGRELVVQANEAAQLVAYYVAEGDEQHWQQVFAQRAAAMLPGYMRPAAYVRLTHLPLNDNGKIDRKALPQAATVSQHSYVAPTSPLEIRLCLLWQQILQVARVGIHDDFFRMGGHSLLATRLVSAIRRQFAVELPIRALFEFPTVAGLADRLQALSEDFVLPDIDKADRQQALPLSYAQQRMWFLDELGEGSAEYIMPGYCILHGEFDEEALRRALHQVLQRHEVLRSHVADENGVLRQVIVEQFELPLAIYDLKLLEPSERLRQIQWLRNKNSTALYQLNRDLMLRAALLKLSSSEQLLLYSLHHIAGDGWSMGILAQELQALYQAERTGVAAQLPALPVQYADYAQWQRSWLQGDVLEQQLAYWRQQLAGLPPVHSLVLDKPRPARQQFQGHAFSQKLDSRTTRDLQLICQQQGVTLFMLLETAFSVLLSRYSNSTDIVVGTPIAGRIHQDLEHLIGLFVNSVVLRTNLSGNPQFSQLLAENKQTILAAYDHQHLPFDMLVEDIRPERDISYNSLFQILFVVQNAEHEPLDIQLPQQGLSAVKPVSIRFDMAVHVAEVAGELLLVWSYRDSLFFDETMRRMAENYSTLLQSIIAQLTGQAPAGGIEQLPMLSAAEQQLLLVQYNSSAADFPTGQCVQQLLEQQVARTPDKVAVICQDEAISYRELNGRANRLARYLLAQGAKPDSLVALSVRRSIDAMVALFGILKAGAGYVPIDPHYPPARYDYMLRDSGATIIVSQLGELDTQDTSGCHVVYLDDMTFRQTAAATAADNIEPEAIGLQPTHMAYMIYTSGSTGQPKGVMVNHHSVINFLYSATALFMTDDIDGSIVSSALTFDATVQSLYLPLMAGKFVELLPPDDEQLFVAMNDYLLDDESRLIFKLTPTHLKGMAAQTVVARNPQSRHVLVVAGEQLTRETLQPWFTERLPNCRFINEYGPTECTVGSCTYEVTSLDFPTASHSVPIGKPMHNVRFYVLDGHRQLVPAGAIGELYIGGTSLARGYLNQPEMTALRFVADPFADAPQARMYKTGDLVRWLPDGNIEFVGRVDHQVKIRGFRVELGEIEAVLAAQPQLSDAVVTVDAKGDDAQLVAYVCPSQDYLRARADEYNAEHVEQWTLVNDDKYADSLAVAEPAKDNFTGWNSSYTGSRIAQEQMLEWLENTVADILALQPRHLLEIGCGGGLLLYRYASHCDSVYGMDISAVALAGLQQELDQRGWDHVKLQVGDALQLEQLAGREFDTIVINSVTQYFPNQLYLEQVIARLLPCLADGGRIFIGDVRNLDLLHAHLAAAEQSHLNQSCPLKTVAARVQRRLQQEPELLISPSFFAQLPTRFAALPTVDILVKRGVGDNELLRYRYDVILRKHSAQLRQPAELAWSEFCGFDQLETKLQATATGSFGIYGVPNSRIEADLALATGLVQWAAEHLVYPLAQPGSLSVAANAQLQRLEQLLTYAGQQGFRAGMTWSQEQPGMLDLIFSREQDRAILARTAYTRGRLTNFPQMARVAQQLGGELRQSIRTMLPDYMTPVLYIAMEQLPSTPSGKVDKKALPKPEDNDLQRSAYVAPRNETEQTLCTLWQSLLNLEKIGVDDDFFALGGHSLLATRLISAIRQQFATELPLRTLFENPTIAQLAVSLTQHSEVFVLPEVRRADRSGPLPLSFAQQRLWFIDQLGQGSAQYNMPGSQLIRGHFDDQAFELAVRTLLERHEVLRTHFVAVNGEPQQVIKSDFQPDYCKVDLTALDAAAQIAATNRYVAEQADKAFDLSCDLMFRVKVLQLAADLHLVLYTTHHIAGDGWSVGIMRNELSSLYAAYREGRANPLEPLKVQYADYAQWQRDWLQGEVLAGAMAYWRRQLADLPILHSLPLDKPRPVVPAHDGLVYRQVLDSALTSRLKLLCRQQEVTPFMLLQSAFALLLGRYSDSDDIVIGTPIAGRTHVDIEPLIGFFINTLVLRTRLVAEQSFAELLQANKKVILDAYAHQHIPFESLVDQLLPERDMSHNPLTQILFAVQNMERGFLDLSEQQRDAIAATDASREVRRSNIRFDLEVNVHELADVMTVSWGFDAALFELSSIAQLAASYQQLLLSIADSMQRGLCGTAPVDAGQYRYYNYLEQRLARPAQPNDILLCRAYTLNAQVNAELMLQAMQQVAERHQLQSRSAGQVPAVVTLTASDELHELIAAHQSAAADPARCEPLLLCRNLADNRYILLLTLGEHSADSTSFTILVRDIDRLYCALQAGRLSPLPDLSQQYLHCRQQQLNPELNETAVEKLRSQFNGMPPLLRLPLTAARSEPALVRAAAVETVIERALYIRLQALSQQLGSSVELVLVSAFAVLLGRYGQTDDLCIGMEVDDRVRFRTGQLLGNFKRYVPLRCKVSAQLQFAQLVSQNRDRLQSALNLGMLPLERLLEALDVPVSSAHATLFQVSFALRHQRAVPVPSSVFALAMLSDNFSCTSTSACAQGQDLALVLDESLAGTTATLSYDSTLFDASTLSQLLARFVSLLSAVVNCQGAPLAELWLPETWISRLPLAAVESMQPPVSVALWSQRLAAFSAAEPDTVAVQEMTFAELEHKASQLANRLAGCRGQLVALALPSAVELAVAITAVIKAGARLVRLSGTIPSLRTEQILAQSGCQWLLDSVEPQQSGLHAITVAGHVTAEPAVEPGIVCYELLFAATGQLHLSALTEQQLSDALAQSAATVPAQLALLLSDSFVATPRQIRDQHDMTVATGAVGQLYFWSASHWVRSANRGRRLPTGSIAAVVAKPVQRAARQAVCDRLTWALQRHQAVVEAVSLAIPGSTSLVSYVVLDGKVPLLQGDKCPTQVFVTDLRLNKVLVPLPAEVLVVPYLPRLRDGSLDLAALPQPMQLAATAEPYVAPADETQMLLCAVWQQLLDHQQPVGVNDNFFALGGHSLIATRLTSVIREHFAVELPLKVLFEAPTVAALAAFIKTAVQQQDHAFVLPSIAPAERFGGNGEPTEEFEF